MEIDKNVEIGDVSPDALSDTSSGNVVRMDVREGLSCEVRTASGNLRVGAAEGSTCEVRLTTHDPNVQRRLAQVECVYDASTNQLLVDTKTGHLTGGVGEGVKKVWTRWIDTVRHDVDIEVLLPVSASVKFRTASGNLRADVTLNDVEVASASGSASLAGVRGSVILRSASGDLEARAVGGSVESRTVSGGISLDVVSGDVDLQTVSGVIGIAIDKAVAARINSVSGDVSIGVAPGLLIDVDATTVSGVLDSEISLATGHGDALEEALQLKVRTVSGDVKIRRS